MPERRPLKPRAFARPNGTEQIIVPGYAAHQRLDAFLGRYGEGRSRTEWARLIQAGAVTLDGRRVRPSDRVAEGQRVQFTPAVIQTAAAQPRPAPEISLTIVYQDPSMIVLNKPPGLVVHPAPGHEDGTLVNALLAVFPDLSDPSGEHRPGIVHRLDKDTSGLIVIGRTTAAMAALQLQFKERSAEKKYLLLVQGDIAEEEAAIEVPIGRDQRDRKRMAARSGGRESRTQFVVLERYGDFSLVEADLQSGRTHQLRVHFQFIGHPVAGDRTYGNVRGPIGLRRQFVHAVSMRIRSPHDDVERQFFAPLPGDLRSPLERLRAIRGFTPDSLPASVTGGKNPPGVKPEKIAIPRPSRRSATSRDASTRDPAARDAAAEAAEDGSSPVPKRPAPSRPASPRPVDRRPPWRKNTTSRPKRGPQRGPRP
jgi:23S rRNA pseudouridine1911/1915/1917 synthase